jgi:hypothetical protein
MKPVEPSALPEVETWGELGPAMRELSPIRQAFVREYVLACLNAKPRKDGRPGKAGAPHGAAVNAARRAGYGKNSKRETLAKHAHDLTRDAKIIEAIDEESKKAFRSLAPQAVAAVQNMILNSDHRDHGRAVFGVIDRSIPVVSKHSIDVTHRTIDPDHEAIEEMRAARKLGATREKLVELYGANGLDRLEALEAIDNARRADAAKIIEHQPQERHG